MKSLLMRNETETNLLVLFHGIGKLKLKVGDKMENFVKFGQKLNLPQTSVMAIQAPLQVPFHDGYCWYPSFDMQGNLLDPTEAQLEQLTRDLEKEFTSLYSKFVPSRIFLLGFGQGAQVSLYFAMNSKPWIPFGGVILIACPFVKLKQVNSMTKVLISASKNNKESHELKKTLGDTCEIEWFDKGSEMPSTPKEAEFIIRFFASNLALRNLSLENRSDIYEIN